MADKVDKATRSRMMSKIKAKDTLPELTIRRALHARGFRYRLHKKNLPGRPDIVLPSYTAVILVHGCFWHAHKCNLFRLPKTRTEFWKDKIETNVKRDQKNLRLLRSQGWRTLIVWECSVKNKNAQEVSRVIEDIAIWLKSDSHAGEISGEK